MSTIILFVRHSVLINTILQMHSKRNTLDESSKKVGKGGRRFSISLVELRFSISLDSIRFNIRLLRFNISSDSIAETYLIFQTVHQPVFEIHFMFMIKTLLFLLR